MTEIEIWEYPSRDRRDWQQRNDDDGPPPILVASYRTLVEAAEDIAGRWRAGRAVALRSGGELADHYRAEYEPDWVAVEHGRQLIRCWGHCTLTGCDQRRDHEWTAAIGAAQYGASTEVAL
jgi:hypothetical protein